MKTSGLFVLCLLSSVTFAQNAQNEIDAHLTAARNAAGFDFTGTLARLCVAPGFTTGIRDAAPGKPPARETWFTEPAKVFDNLYFVGSKLHSSWALTTSDGIILIDTLYTYNSEEEIVGGLKKLGLDPAKVKYVIITHAHGDHVGGAKLMQDRFKSHIVMGGPDWDSIEKSVNGYPEGKPKRDIVADDGQKLTLGDTTVTLYITPGHTPGTISSVFPVKDNGTPHLAALWGGAGLNADRESVQTYIRSAQRFSGIVKQAGADIILANHTDWDRSKINLPMLAKRAAGSPNPYIVGNAKVLNFLKVAEECATARVGGAN